MSDSPRPSTHSSNITTLPASNYDHTVRNQAGKSAEVQCHSAAAHACVLRCCCYHSHMSRAALYCNCCLSQDYPPLPDQLSANDLTQKLSQLLSSVQQVKAELHKRQRKQAKKSVFTREDELDCVQVTLTCIAYVCCTAVALVRLRCKQYELVQHAGAHYPSLCCWCTVLLH